MLNKLKPVLQILTALTGMVVITTITNIVPGLLYGVFTSIPFNEAMDTVIISPAVQLSSTVLSCLLHYFFIRFLLRREGKTMKAAGFTGKGGRKVCLGFLTGAAMMVLILLPLYLTGSYHLVYRPLDGAILQILLAGFFNFITVAFSEEIIFRGYIQYTLSRKSPALGCLITAAVFAVIHLFNASYTLVSLIYLFIGGLLLSLMRLATKGLAFPIGFHLAWNWVLTRVFGVQSENSWLQTVIPEYTVWNGGQTGPESGIVGLILLFLTTSLFYLYYRRTTQANTAGKE